jgi:cytochrome c-type protein NapB
MSFSKQSQLFLLVFLGVLVASGALSQAVFPGSGLSAGKPGMNTYPAGPPGETTTLDRPYNGAPPLVPHSVIEFNISRSANECLDCHLEGEEVEKGHIATKVPVTHYVDVQLSPVPRSSVCRRTPCF